MPYFVMMTLIFSLQEMKTMVKLLFPLWVCAIIFVHIPVCHDNTDVWLADDENYGKTFAMLS